MNSFFERDQHYGALTRQHVYERTHPNSEIAFFSLFNTAEAQQLDENQTRQLIEIYGRHIMDYLQILKQGGIQIAESGAKVFNIEAEDLETIFKEIAKASGGTEETIVWEWGNTDPQRGFSPANSLGSLNISKLNLTTLLNVSNSILDALEQVGERKRVNIIRPKALDSLEPCIYNNRRPFFRYIPQENSGTNSVLYFYHFPDNRDIKYNTFGDIMKSSYRALKNELISSELPALPYPRLFWLTIKDFYEAREEARNTSKN